MRKYLVKRLFQIVLTLFIYLTITFIILQAQPGDITNVYVLNPKIPPEVRERLREQLGLDKPLFFQYLQYLQNMATGNLGISFSQYPRPVWEIIKERLPRTVLLFLVAYLIYFFFGYQMGKLIAWKRSGVLEYSSTIIGSFLYTVFTPWWALLMLWIFAFKLGWLPNGKFITVEIWRNFRDISANQVFNLILIAGGAMTAFIFLSYYLGRRLGTRRAAANVTVAAVIVSVGAIAFLIASTTVGYLAADILKHLILPVVTLSTINFAGYMLLMRNSMLETIREDYVMAARAKGLPDRVVRNRHAARNALLPIVTSFILALATVVDGGIITETLFSWPGIGLTMLNAILSEDMPLAMGALVFTGIFLLIGHLVADLLYAYLDPRIKYS
ncbi:MAG: ABC transporter permease [Candidatus Acetothermia bacterium]|jgi:peptide/nickel transport system permease protein|nr:ABC transporter permease [Candidatus Acetothermia bacterium]MDH7505722.1 ABC transporter permease [Candidatus Acetothermia bacterium]